MVHFCKNSFVLRFTTGMISLLVLLGGEIVAELFWRSLKEARSSGRVVIVVVEILFSFWFCYNTKFLALLDSTLFFRCCKTKTIFSMIIFLFFFILLSSGVSKSIKFALLFIWTNLFNLALITRRIEKCFFLRKKYRSGILFWRKREERCASKENKSMTFFHRSRNAIV